MADEYTGLQDLRWQISELNLPDRNPRAAADRIPVIQRGVARGIRSSRQRGGTPRVLISSQRTRTPWQHPQPLCGIFPLAPYGDCPGSWHQRCGARSGLSCWPAGINPDTAETFRTIRPPCLSQTAPRIHRRDCPGHHRSIRQFSGTLPRQIPGKSLQGFRAANHW